MNRPYPFAIPGSILKGAPDTPIGRDYVRGVEGAVGVNPERIVPPSIPPAGPPVAGPIVPEGVQTAPIDETSRDASNAAEAENYWKQMVTPNFGFGGKGLQPAVMPAYEDWPAIQGVEGKNLFQETFTDIPNRMAETSRNIGTLQQAQSEDTSEYLKKEGQRQAEEHAAMRESQLQRQQEFQARQQQMDTAVQRYTNDLADTGQYWRQPGSMIASFGAALVAMGSPGDPGIGLRTIQNAIDSDFQKRKVVADTHLGALKSNIAQYREFMQDANAGDMLAYAESNRIAALELQRIGQQFQGPLYREKAQLVSDELMAKANGLKIQAYNSLIYNKPHLVDPRLKNEVKATGQAMGEMGPSPLKGSWDAGGNTDRSGSPPDWLAKAMGDYKPKASSAGKALANVPNGSVDKGLAGSKDFDALVNSRAPDAMKLAKMFKQEYATEAMRLSGSRATPDKLTEKVQELVYKDDEAVSKAAATATKEMSYIKGASALNEDIRRFESAAKAAGYSNPNELLDTLRQGGMEGFAQRYRSMQQSFAGKPGSPEERQVQENLAATERFYQLISQGTNAYYSKVSGAAISDTERPRLEGVISTKGSFEQFKQFGEMNARGAGNDFGAATVGLTPRQKTLMRIRFGLNAPMIDSPGAVKGK